VIGVVVGQGDVRHGFGQDTEVGERIQDQGSASHHPGIHDDQRVPVTYEGDCRRGVQADVARVEQVDRGHRAAV
jgi:hypothetical protein